MRPGQRARQWRTEDLVSLTHAAANLIEASAKVEALARAMGINSLYLDAPVSLARLAAELKLVSGALSYRMLSYHATAADPAKRLPLVGLPTRTGGRSAAKMTTRRLFLAWVARFETAEWADLTRARRRLGLDRPPRGA